jgi:hypothetical protein
MTKKAEDQASNLNHRAGRGEWVAPTIKKMRAGSAEVGTRVTIQDGPLAESRS